MFIMEIIIDAGNTCVKVYFFNANTVIKKMQFAYDEQQELFNMLSEYSNYMFILSDVKSVIAPKMRSLFKKQTFVCESTGKLPIEIDYETKETLGFDRIADAAGAVFLSPNTHKLIIDMGTAITIDYVSDKNIFEGGVISPGMHIRFAALHEKTGKLPLASYSDQISLCPKSTLHAIESGVVQGIVFEIHQYIAEYKTIFPDIQVFLCGGDAFFFEKMVKKPIFAEPNLLAFGLHSIYNYNVT